MDSDLLTVVPSMYLEQLKREGQLNNVDLMPNINIGIKKAISKYLYNNAGINVSIPLATLYRTSDKGKATLDRVGTEIEYFLPVQEGTTIWQLTVKQDLIVSITYSNLQKHNDTFKDTPEEIHDILGELLQEDLMLGPLDEPNEDVISFIPFIGLDDCRYVAAVDSTWTPKDLDIPGVRPHRLTSFTNLYKKDGF